MSLADDIAAIAAALRRQGHDGLCARLQLEAGDDVTDRLMILRCRVAEVLAEPAINAETRVLASAAYEALNRALA